MERILSVYIMVIAITFAVVLTALRGDGPLSQKWAKVRVRADENRGKGIPGHPRMQEPAEEEFNMGRVLALMLFGMMMLLFMVLNNM